MNMHQPPEIAIIEQNTLTALGLRTILEELLPEAVLRVFDSFAAFVADTPDMYAHYFVSSQIYFEHSAYFLERRPRAIVLSAGENPLLKSVPVLNICLPQDVLVQSIMKLRSHGHSLARNHKEMPPAPLTDEHELTPREIEVLVLVTRGLINKEIADLFNISIHTVISHRRNITRKTGIKTVAGLTVYALLNNLIDASSVE